MIVVLVSLATIGYVKVSLSSQIVQMSHRLASTYEIIGDTKSMNLSLFVVRLTERGYLLTGEERYLSSLERNAQTFRNQVDALLPLFDPSSEDRRLLLAIQEDFEHFLTDAVIPLLALRVPLNSVITVEEQRRYSALMDSSRAIADALSLRIATFEERQQDALAARRLEVERLSAIDRKTTIIGPIAIVMVTLLAGLYATVRLDHYKSQQQRDQEELRIARDRWMMVITSSNLGTWEWNMNSDVLAINDRFASLLGYERAELEPLTTKRLASLIHPDDYVQTMGLVGAVIEGDRQNFQRDIRVRHKDGHWVWVLDQGQVVKWDEDGKPVMIIGTHTDISERIEAAELLSSKEEESRKLVETMVQGFAYCQLIVDEHGRSMDFRVLRINAGFVQQTGLDMSYLGTRSFKEVVPAIDEDSPWIVNNKAVAQSGKSMTFEASGPVSGRLFRISSYCPQIGYFAMIIEDITQQRALEMQLAEEKQLFETTLFNIADGVITTDEQGIVQFMNPSAELLTGWRSGEAQGQGLSTVFKTYAAHDRSRQRSPFERVIEERQTVISVEDTTLVSRDGIQRYVAGKSTPILDSDEHILGIVIIVRDITEERKRQQEILDLSYVDPLTGLFNRRYYDQSRVELDTVGHCPLSLIIVDVNGLKLTNDAFGHDAGDELLQSVASTLKEASPPSSVLCRIGGDEFVLLLPHSADEVAVSIIEDAIGSLANKHVRDVPVSVSFGHATKIDEHTPYESLFKQAEDVMYQSKLRTNLKYKKAMITTILNRLFEHDPHLSDHSEQVGFYSSECAKALGFPRDEVAQMRLAGLYHDIGRIALTPSLLQQSDELLTKGQQIELRRHSEIGYNILSSVADYAFIARAVLHHHERWDGRGYPQALKGNLIPRSSQILGLANAYVDALEAAGATVETAKRTIEGLAGSHFDPELVHLFITEVVKAS